MYVEAVNESLRGIPPEQIRYHTCYGINEGPRIHEAALGDVVGAMLKVNAFAYSFEAANARHEHEYPEVHPTVVWAKFEAMRDGARLATRQLWS